MSRFRDRGAPHGAISWGVVPASSSDNVLRQTACGALGRCLPHDHGGAMAQHTSCAILIVEDEPSIATALAGLLDRQGYTVTTAGNGALAWEHLRTQCYDVILCDIHMPELDG